MLKKELEMMTNGTTKCHQVKLTKKDSLFAIVSWFLPPLHSQVAYSSEKKLEKNTI